MNFDKYLKKNVFYFPRKLSRLSRRRKLVCWGLIYSGPISSGLNSEVVLSHDGDQGFIKYFAFMNYKRCKEFEFKNQLISRFF